MNTIITTTINSFYEKTLTPQQVITSLSAFSDTLSIEGKEYMDMWKSGLMSDTEACDMVIYDIVSRQQVAKEQD